MKIKYRTFKIPKRSGGMRKIEQPLGEGMEYLKQLLTEFEDNEQMKPSYFAHAFMHGRNIVTCAKQHFGKKYILRVDIKDFFNAITYPKFTSRVRMSKELSEKVFDCFRLVKGKDAYLSQGAPTSPFLSNTYMRTFDWKCAWYCHNFDVVYNRYADDMFISTNELNSKFWSCHKFICEQLRSHELKENKKKRKLMHQGKRMEVVGIVLNEKFQINRYRRRIIRAMLHNAKNDKLTNEQKGWLNFKNMVEKYEDEKLDNVTICKAIRIANNV